MLNQPTFIGIGAMRTGTSFVYMCLQQHPDIHMSTPKECNYFDKEPEYPLEQYNAKFVTTKKFAGEISPTYLYIDGTAERIKEALGDVKIFVILRNPIDRAWSHYYFMKSIAAGVNSEHTMPTSFHHALLLEPMNIRINPHAYGS